MNRCLVVVRHNRPIVKFLDFFRGSQDERIASRYMTALREAGERRRLAYDANERVVVAYDEQGAGLNCDFSAIWRARS